MVRGHRCSLGRHWGPLGTTGDHWGPSGSTGVHRGPWGPWGSARRRGALWRPVSTRNGPGVGSPSGSPPVRSEFLVLVSVPVGVLLPCTHTQPLLIHSAPLSRATFSVAHSDTQRCARSQRSRPHTQVTAQRSHTSQPPANHGQSAKRSSRSSSSAPTASASRAAMASFSLGRNLRAFSTQIFAAGRPSSTLGLAFSSHA
jgi:hypothetical protein